MPFRISGSADGRKDTPTPRSGLRGLLVVLAVALLVGLLVVPHVLSQSQAPATVEPTARTRRPAPAGNVMDAPLRIIAEAQQSYAGVKDFSCTLIKKERIRGQMQPDNIINMKLRNQPFSVYLRWLGPKELAGQEACYFEGKNNGMLRVHSTGLLGLAGWVSISPDDPRALANTEHKITEAGIGKLIERFAIRWKLERGWNKTQVRIAEYEYNKRKCVRVETIHPDNTGKQFYSYRSVVYFDKETHLPVRVETYDWPKPGGNPNGEVKETYSYINMRTNVGLGNDSFSY